MRHLQLRTENNRYRACKVCRKFHYLVKKIHQRWHKPCASTRFLDSHLRRKELTWQAAAGCKHSNDSPIRKRVICTMAVSQLWAISTYWPIWSYSGKEAKVLTFTLRICPDIRQTRKKCIVLSDISLSITSSLINMLYINCIKQYKKIMVAEYKFRLLGNIMPYNGTTQTPNGRDPVPAAEV